jgi:hypothetical protein
MKRQKWPTFTPPATAQRRRYHGRVLLRRSQEICSCTGIVVDNYEDPINYIAKL